MPTAPALAFASPPERILLVRLSHLGDACHALAVYHHLRAQFPNSELYWAIQPEFAGLLDGLPGITGLVTLERSRGWRAWPKIRNTLRPMRFDLTVDAQGNWKSGVLSRLSRAPIRFGMAACDWRERSASRMMTHFASPAEGPHAMHRMRAICEGIGPNIPFEWHLPLSAEEMRSGIALLQSALPTDGAKPRRIIHLSVPGDRRSWPGEYYRELASALALSGERVLCVSGPGEAHLGAHLSQTLREQSDVSHLVGQRGLRQLASLFWAAGQEGLRLLACDSGPSHMAASVGMGVDLLAGPTKPERTGPWPTEFQNAERKSPVHRVLKDDQVPTMETLDPHRVHAWLQEPNRISQ